MNIAILYGTETGNAEMLADDVATELGGAQDTSVSSLADIDPDTLRGTDLNIILCSSYGDGELPASAKPFAEKIETGKPDLSGVKFAIFGLGDSEYHATYGSGSMRLADMLVQCGATQLGERIVHDAAGGDLPEDLALPWATEIITSLTAA
ncbi:MAG: flavodoxin domain-containing protein [Sulfitobacter dubius]|tara:strand:- start:46 stop:498 length:453 start_codon:yes stop_codon:yes gene_type:complete